MQTSKRIQDDASLAGRYLGGTLSDTERETYEQHFIENPEAVQELEAAARMKVGLANLRDSGQLVMLEKTRSTSWRRPAGMALAASIALAVVGVALWRGMSIDSDGLMSASAELIDRAGQRLVVGESYALLRTRGTDYDAIVELPAQPAAIELRVRPESQAPTYRATLSRIQPDGSILQVAAVNELRMESDRFVRLYVDSTRLEPGPYLLVLSASDGAPREVAASAFRLKVLPARNAG